MAALLQQINSNQSVPSILFTFLIQIKPVHVFYLEPIIAITTEYINWSGKCIGIIVIEYLKPSNYKIFNVLELHNLSPNLVCAHIQD